MTGPEVTAAMKAEDVWVEKAARGWWDWGAAMRKATGNGREWDQLDEDERALVRPRVRTALAPVVPLIAGQALRDAADEIDAYDKAPDHIHTSMLRSRADRIERGGPHG